MDLLFKISKVPPTRNVVLAVPIEVRVYVQIRHIWHEDSGAAVGSLVFAITDFTPAEDA